MIVERLSLSSYKKTVCLTFMHIPHLNHLNELAEGRRHTLNHKTESLPPSNPLVESGRLLGFDA